MSVREFMLDNVYLDPELSPSHIVYACGLLPSFQLMRNLMNCALIMD